MESHFLDVYALLVEHRKLKFFCIISCIVSFEVVITFLVVKKIEITVFSETLETHYDSHR